MEKLMLFLHIIAWVFAIVSTIYAGLLTFWAITYPGSLDEIMDKAKGYTKTFKPGKFWLIAIICWAFIIAF